MKRQYGDCAGRACIADSVFTVAQVESLAFHRVASLYIMRRAREPLYKPVVGEITRIADNGFRWLQLYSAGARHQTYTVTTMFTSENVVAQWYIDICAGHGVHRSGIPWHDDLSLAVVVNGRGGLTILDADDLESTVENRSGAAGGVSSRLERGPPSSGSARPRGAPTMMRIAGEAFGAMRMVERGGAVAGYTRLATRGASVAVGKPRAQ